MSGSTRQGVIPPTGLTVLFNPHKPSLDIVFLHGFTGHPERTWTQKKGDMRQRYKDGEDGDFVEPPPKIRRLNPFQKSRHEGGNSNSAVYWPQDLVPVTIPYARVLTYGYDTHVRHFLGPPVSSNTVYDIAWDFLVNLEAERRLEPSRPVLFIAHSLGGIIVKETLRRSSGCHVTQPHLRSVFDSTLGIMFFGTPHGGADPRGLLQRIAERAIKAAGFSFNEQIVNTLLPSAERLRELRDEFSPMAHQQNWMIYSFQEQLGVKLLSGCKVVEDTSSYLNFPSIETTQHIARNHMEICRFTGPDDMEYKKVAAALHRITKTVSSQAKGEEAPSLNQEQRRILMDSLRFDQINARQMTIKSAHTKTCRWLLKNIEYIDWLDAAKLHEHHGFLWIKGKPGTGKSTIMKFAHANSRKMKDIIIISFFFNARGGDLEKSTAGMYRSLLLQLLERVPKLQSVLDSLESITWNSSDYSEWTVETLKDLFQQAIQRLGPFSVMCFIDALDECEERQIRDMVTFFQRLGQLSVLAQIRFHVCFSSRHYPHISINKGLSLVLEGQEEHTQDIINYIDSELNIGYSKLAKQIRVELQEKASGVFMWVVLVVDILNTEHDGGRIHVLRQRLREIPGDLHELFRDILTRDHRNRNELLLCIQWLLFARQPLKPEQLYFAVISGIGSENLSKWDPEEIGIDVIKRFILNSSKGLAEITKSKAPSVQFIHESVRDFLLKENGLRELWSDLGSNFRGHSHEQLKQCCLNYMSIDIAADLDTSNPLPKAFSQQAIELRQSADEAFPFLEYAVRNVLYHADASEEGGVNQKDFLQYFRLLDWIKLSNLFEKHEVRRHNQTTSLLYILAENNLPSLIRVHPGNLSCFEMEDERYGPPIFAALATGSSEAVRTLLEIQAEIQPPTSPLHSLRKQYCRDGYKWAGFRRNFIFARQRDVHSYLAEHGNEILLSFSLEIAKYKLETKDRVGRTPLSWAAGQGHGVVVTLLLKKGAELESKDNDGRTPLSWAAAFKSREVVELLLEKGAELESKDKKGQTPLFWAAGRGSREVVELLCEKGAELESKDKDSRTPLWSAVNRSSREVV